MPAHKIFYNFATRSRPEKCLSCLSNITSLAKHDNYQIIVTADIDDATMFNENIRNAVNAFPNTKIIYGTSLSKVDAINKNVGLADSDWTVLVNMSDDFVFLSEEFDLQILSDMDKYFPDTDGFLHYPDGTPAKEVLATMSIMGRAYYKRFNYIYHSDYNNVYCDQESTNVAKRLKKYQYVDIELFHHLHPVWKLAEWDEQYRKTEDKAGYERDYQVYLKRNSRNFDL